ncbi:unnamed protein product, partial [Coregonus sp. 'balchen']
EKQNGICGAVIKEAGQDFGKWKSHVCNQDQDGTFRWVDKTDIMFSNWKPNFPKNTANLWDCGDFSGKWETTNCFKNLGYICKMILIVMLDIFSMETSAITLRLKW